MSLEGPDAIIYSSAGIEATIGTGVAIPVGTPGLLSMGSDGTNARFVSVNGSGQLVVVGAGVAGTPAGGVVSVQGVTGGTPLNVTNPSVGTIDTTAPTSGTFISGTDGTNLRALKAFDIDTGAGTDWNLGVSIRLPASGGSVAGGTATNPLRIDPTGTTTQPISAASLPLPSGAATEATLSAVLTTTAFQARINTLGQKTSANSTPVVIASDNTLSVQAGTVSTATLSNVTSSATSVTLAALNSSRKGLLIFNDSTQLLYVKFGATASLTSFTVRIASRGYFEMPEPIYTGVVDGIWAAANGAARVTELL